MRLLVLLSVFCWMLPVIPASAQDSGGGLFGADSSINFKATYLEKFLFRGRILHDDTAYQGEVGLGISSWSYNLTYTEAQDPLDLDVMPLAFTNLYQHSVSFTTVDRHGVTTLGYNFHDYDFDKNSLIPASFLSDTQEFFVRYSNPSKWNPTWGISYDIDAYKGYYLDFSFSRNIPMSRKSQLLASFRGGLSYGLDEEIDERGRIEEPGYFGEDGYNHSQLQLDWVWQMTRNFKLQVGGAYHYAHDDALRFNEDDGQFVGQASLSLSLP